MIRLTKPQMTLLKSLADGPHYTALGYPPAVKLEELGLIEVRETRFSTMSYVTAAGRAALVAEQRPEVKS